MKLDLGAIQVLRNAVGVGGCQLSRKKALGAIQVLRNAFSQEIGPHPPTPS